MPTLDSIADELYTLDPAEFVTARSEYAAKAREAGDRELTVAIGRLRKPTVAAWMVNLLARERADELGALFDLGDQLRTAQRKLSGHDLRRLSAQRRQVVALLERDAGRLASKRGRHPSDSALREVAQTLNAALADPEVAERVRAGHLDATVEAGGFGDLTAVPLTVVRDPDEDEDRETEDHDTEDHETGDRPARGGKSTATKSGGDRHGPDRAERKKAEADEREREAREKAAADAASARKAADEARVAAGRAQDELAAAEARIAELREQLAHAEQQREFARSAANSAKKELTAAERAASAADAALVRLGG